MHVDYIQKTGRIQTIITGCGKKTSDTAERARMEFARFGDY
jgi:hypothetical protein